MPVPRCSPRGSRRSWACQTARVVSAVVAAALLPIPVGNAYGAQPSGRVIRVGPQRTVKRIADAARIARDGDIVEIEAGDYPMDVASWPQSGLTIRGVGGRARLDAAGASAEGKAIWVLKGDNVTVEHIEFSGARVADENGAGIRHEGPGKLVVRDCRFTANEMGLLSSNHPLAELVVERSEFDHNAVAAPRPSRDSIGHQIYVGRIARFTLRDSYLHHGMRGHLVKSRARESFLYHNRITDESGGRASYEVEFPDGGVAHLVGNIVQQAATTENPTLVAYGAESHRWPRNELLLVHNTLVDDSPQNGIVVRVFRRGSKVTSVNNLLLGTGTALAGAKTDLSTDARARPADVPRADSHDYRLSPSSPLANRVDAVSNASWRMTREYVHPRSSRLLAARPHSYGALQTHAD